MSWITICSQGVGQPLGAMGGGGDAKVKRRKLLLVAAALGLLAAILTYTYIRTLETSDTQTVKEVGVLVAANDIPAGATVGANMVRLAQVHVGSVHPEAAISTAEVVGRITKAPIFQGEQILRSRLLPAGVTPSLTFAIPSDKRAISVAVNEVVGVAGFIKPGDRVDVLATIEGSSGDDQVTSTVLQDVEVLAIAQDMEEEVDKKPRVTTTVTLAVTLDEAQRVTLAEETGTLRLALRPVSAANREWVNPTTGSELAQVGAPPRAPQRSAQPAAAVWSPPKPPTSPKPPQDYEVEIIRGTDRELVSVKPN